MRRTFHSKLFKKNLILIIAREGSKNIARQNLRLVNEKPLFYYVLEKSLKIKNTDVYVSTDSQEISELTKFYGGSVIERPKSLTLDNTRLEDISFHALNYLKKEKKSYEKCLVLSPMFPLINEKTISKFFQSISKKVNTVFGYTDSNQVGFGKKTLVGGLVKLEEQKNPSVKLEKIVSFDCKSFLKLKKNLHPFYGIEIKPDEIFYVKDYHDFEVLEKKITRRKILIRVDGSKRIGLGHVYNMLTILNHFRNDDLLIVMNNRKNFGASLFRENLYKVKFFSRSSELIDIISKFKPDIIFNDILNTDPTYMRNLKENGCMIINFEDLGKGRNFADLVFNPIFYKDKKIKNEFYGPEFACVRDEFRIWDAGKIRKNVKRVLITFGGTDQNAFFQTHH